MKRVTKAILDTLLFLMRFVLISAEFCENTFYQSVVALPAGVKLSRIRPQLTQASTVNRKYLTKLHTNTVNYSVINLLVARWSYLCGTDGFFGLFLKVGRGELWLAVGSFWM